MEPTRLNKPALRGYKKMEKRVLGRTGIEVSRLCFGTLPMGPLQKNIALGKGVPLLRKALDLGINFFDTAESYRTHPFLAGALAGREADTVVATKSPAADYEAMMKSVERARKELGRARLDIMLLHAARSADPFRERAGALECLVECRTRGLVRAIGISTHIVTVVGQAAEKEDIDVIHPLVNETGMGIMGGGREEMARAIARAAGLGKGIYGMKALAGGNLAERAASALRYAFGLQGIDSFAVGMVTEREIVANVLFLQGDKGAEKYMAGLETEKKKLVILRGLCRGCGACAEKCPAGAIALAGGRAAIIPDKCILCGYCGPVCPEFAIRFA